MASSSTFSSSGEEAITRTLEVKSEKTPKPWTSEFREYYDVDRTVRQLREGNYQRIALQFPDELLHDSVPISLTLRRELEDRCEVYIMADTSYGSCCVDEVAASHVDADVIVHYGHACMSQTSRLPVIYVFGVQYFDEETCVSTVVDYLSRSSDAQSVGRLTLKHDVRYWKQAPNIAEKLRLALSSSWNVEFYLIPDRTCSSSRQDSREIESAVNSTSSISNTTDLNIQNAPGLGASNIILWIGEESPTLTKLLMTAEGRQVIAYSPRTNTIQTQSHFTNKLLMRRYAIVQKARDADVFGILVGTLGVSSYLPLISHLRIVLKKSHKKSYTVSVGKINPAKLANFMEIECWVWVTCSEGMIDSKEFLRPIITPFELELALQQELSWTGKYILDFETILAEASQKDTEPNGDKGDEERPMFSMTTGKYRHAKRYGVEVPENSSNGQSDAIALRSQDTALAKLEDSAAVDFLQNRSYRGLDPRIGQDEPSILEQGRSGIAREYGNADSNG